jgi:integrase/recombinase XerD
MKMSADGMNTMTFSEVLAEFARRRNDAAKTDSGVTGNRYVREVAGRLDEHGEVMWKSDARVKPWALWLKTERDKTVWEATHADVRAHLRAMLGAGYAPTTMNLRLSSISKFYQEVKKMEAQPEHILPAPVPENPAKDLDKSDFNLTGNKTKRAERLRDGGNVHAPTPEELKLMCDNVPGKGAYALRDELLIRLMAWTGLRRGEVEALKLEDINQYEHTIWVPPIKSGERRTIPYPETLDQWLNPWLHSGYRDAVAKSFAGKSNHLFPTKESASLSGHQINEIVKQAAVNAGIQEDIGPYMGTEQRRDGATNKITAHSLRHHYGVQSVKSGIPITYLKKLMGHHSVSVTEVYLDLAKDDVIEVGRLFDPSAESLSKRDGESQL